MQKVKFLTGNVAGLPEFQFTNRGRFTNFDEIDIFPDTVTLAQRTIVWRKIKAKVGNIWTKYYQRDNVWMARKPKDRQHHHLRTTDPSRCAMKCVWFFRSGWHYIFLWNDDSKHNNCQRTYDAFVACHRWTVCSETHGRLCRNDLPPVYLIYYAACVILLVSQMDGGYWEDGSPIAWSINSNYYVCMTRCKKGSISK